MSKLNRLSISYSLRLGGVQGQCVLEVALAANANVTSLRLTASAANITAIMPKLASF